MEPYCPLKAKFLATMAKKESSAQLTPLEKTRMRMIPKKDSVTARAKSGSANLSHLGGLLRDSRSAAIFCWPVLGSFSSRNKEKMTGLSDFGGVPSALAHECEAARFIKQGGLWIAINLHDELN